ncbi:MAG TPA: hypothetical protein VOA64_13590 [Candidatus Dormibacteraeota bacterium]|nr:hypothetical protein [Candidatus Dormibacteraeota bacterium]
MSRRSKIVLTSFGTVVLLFLFFFHGCDHISEETLAFPPPLENVTVHTFATLEWVTRPSQRIGIHLKQQSDIKQLVDLRVFGDFQPEMTDETATAQFGKPVQTRTDDFGATWSRYSTPFGYVEIGLDRRTSLSDDDDNKGPVPGRRSLRAYTEKSPSKVFRSPLLDLLDQAEKKTPRAEDREVDFFNSEHRLILDVSVKKSRITHMELFRHVDR